MVFDVHCNRVFYKFPGRSLLWTTTVVHDILCNCNMLPPSMPVTSPNLLTCFWYQTQRSCLQCPHTITLHASQKWTHQLILNLPLYWAFIMTYDIQTGVSSYSVQTTVTQEHIPCHCRYRPEYFNSNTTITRCCKPVHHVIYTVLHDGHHLEK